MWSETEAHCQLIVVPQRQQVLLERVEWNTESERVEEQEEEEEKVI